MRILIVLLTTVALLAVSGATYAAEIEDHPLVSRYEGSIPSRRDESAFQEYKLITGIVPDSLEFESLPLEGRFTRVSYQNPLGRSAQEIYANYVLALQGAGAEVLFQCVDAECGPGFAGSRWGRFNGTIHLPGAGAYVAALIKSGEQSAYVAVGVTKNRHQVTILEVENMETGLVEIDAEALGNELDLMGHVAIPGVYFETGKATLTTESGPALQAMATILSARPGANVWVVGHTDWTGGLDLNLGLSADRARAVVRALADDYGIAASRLEGHGVGPLAPAASNAGEAGRAANRRVELVLRR
ncbi:OmpA family protein [Oricola sp.]|uniref:OmpA family protein n=1 Tax=Oricola sp. TaxID=1979950 RepID=UPI003BA866B8